MRHAVALVVLIAGLVLCAPAYSMPLRPDLVVHLEEENRIEEAREMLGLDRSALSAMPDVAMLDSVRALVLLVDFDDVPADTILHSTASFREMLFGRDHEYSMRNYYLWNSYGKLDIAGEVYGWFRVAEPMSYYADNRKGMGSYPRNTQKLIEDAVDVADEVVDFSRFDNDGPDGMPNSGDDDGFVDYLLVVHGGQGYEWTMNPAHIHSHASTIRSKPVDGVLVRAYATEPENGKVGTFAHEIGHLFGLPDLYDVTLNSFGLGMCSLMAYGSWGGGDGSRPVGLDAWSKIRLGFLEPTVIDINHEAYQLPCIEDGPHALRLWSEAALESQYFIVENRRAKSWDSYLSWSGEGLLVYHVDERYGGNSSEGVHLISLEQADGQFDLEKRRIFGFGSDDGDPYPGATGNRHFSWATVPSNYSNEGEPTQVSLRNIGDAGDIMTFDVEVHSPVLLFQDYSIDDSSGDGDGEPDPGEEFILALRLRNRGIACSDVVVHLSTEDPHVEPAQTTISFGSIWKNTVSRPLGFQVLLDEDVPEPYEIEFEVTVEGDHKYGRYQSNDQFILAVPLRRLEGWPRFAGDAISSALSLADLDNDGPKEVIVGCTNGYVYAWHADGTEVDGWPVSLGSTVASKPAVCDVDLDGNPDVVVTSTAGSVFVLRNDGTMCPGWPQATGGSILSTGLLADIDDDGMVEVVCASTDGNVYAWNGDGVLVPGWPVDVGGFPVWMSPAAADVDGDYLSEIIVGGYGGQLYVINGDGSLPEGWPVEVGKGCGRGSPSIADFDGDGSLDIAVSGLFSNSIYLLDLDGSVKEGWPTWSFNCDELSSPVPADIDNDGLAEVAASTSCGTIIVWDGNATVSRRIDAQAPHPIWHCEPVFVDLDGNGSIEGVVGTTTPDMGEVYAFGENGSLIGFPIQVEGNIWATPALGDIDLDGNAEIVVATTAGAVYAWRFVGAKKTGRIEYSQSRGDIWNTGWYRFTPRDNVPMADLALSASDIVIDPLRPREGEALSVTVTVANAGHTAAEQFTVSLYHDVIADSTRIGSAVIAGLAAKSDTVVSFDWAVPGGEPTRLIYAEVDAGGVPERSELNNRASQRFYLSLADLVAMIDEIHPMPVTLGDSVTLEVSLKNTGQDVARDFGLALYDSIVESGRCFASYEIDSLVPGESLEFSSKVNIEAFRSDFIRMWAVADPEGGVLEYYMSNNASSRVVYSGVEGKILATPYTIGINQLRASRTSVAITSGECFCVSVCSADEPFDIVFEAKGEDVDLARNVVVFSSLGDIVGFDLADGVLFVVSSGHEPEREPALWGDDVVWVADSPESTSLRIRRGSGSVETIRSLRGGIIENPDMSGAIVAWQEKSGDDWNILGYDLEADSMLVLSDGPGDQVNASVWGKTVLWEDRSRDGGDIVGVNCESGRLLSVAAVEGMQQSPVVYGDLVVWQDSRNGNWDIYGCSLKTGEEFPLSRQIDDQVKPSLSDSTVFWVDKRGPTDAVVGLRFGGHWKVADVERFEALAQDGQIKIIAQVKEYDDDIEYRIYRFPDDRPMSQERFSHVRDRFTLGGESTYVYADTLIAQRRSFFYTLGVIDGYGEEVFYGPSEAIAYRPAPTSFSMGRPFPNPFRYTVNLVFGLPRQVPRGPDSGWPDPSSESCQVEVGVYSVTGRRVRVLRSGNTAPGYYRISWDGTNDRGSTVSPGVYFMVASGADHVISRKVILAR